MNLRQRIAARVAASPTARRLVRRAAHSRFGLARRIGRGVARRTGIRTG